MGVIKLNDIEYGGGGGAGVSSYSDLTDKPTINGVEVDGDLTGEVYSLLSKDENGSVELAPSGGSGGAAGTSSLSVGSANAIGTAAAPSQGQFSAAIGTGNTVAGASTPVQGSIAVGASNTVTGSQSAAFGQSNQVDAAQSLAAGNGNSVTGAKSSAFGDGNTVSGAGAAALGTSLNVGQASQVAVGKFNENKANTVFEVGGGTGVSGDADERKNLMEVRANGDLNVAGNFLVNGGILSNMFQRSDIYSTTERMIGQWIDGKPLYQKTYSFVGDGSSMFYFDTNATNIVLVDGFLAHLNPNNNNSHGLPYYFGREEDASTSQKMLYVVLNSSGETFVNNHRYFATIKYTKTTDSASSYHVATAYDYSTSETVIGTWIDGSPVFQKTITGLNIALSWSGSNFVQSAEIPIGVLPVNADKIISCFGTVMGHNSTGTFLTSKSVPMSVYQYFVDSTNLVNRLAFVTNMTDGLDAATELTLQYTK